MCKTEYTEIINVVGKESSMWKDILLSFGGVIMGFALAEGTAWIRRFREKQKIGKSFDFEITALKEPLKMQVADVRNLKVVIGKYENISPSLFIFKNLDYVKSLDRHIVNEYFKSKYGENSLKRTREIYNTLTVIDAEMERYSIFYDGFNIKLTANHDSYKIIMNEFSRSLSDYIIANDSEKKNDLYVLEIVKLLKITVLTGEPLSYIMPFEATLHLPLVDLNIKGHAHPFAEKSSNFNQRALDIIMNVKIDTDAFLHKIEIVEKSLIGCYEKIYQVQL